MEIVYGQVAGVIASRLGGHIVIMLKPLVLQVIVVPAVAGYGQASVVYGQFPEFPVVDLPQTRQQCRIYGGPSRQMRAVGLIACGSVQQLSPVKCRGTYKEEVPGQLVGLASCLLELGVVVDSSAQHSSESGIDYRQFPVILIVYLSGSRKDK